MKKVETIIEASLMGSEGLLLNDYLPASKYLLVTDENIYHVLAERIVNLTGGKTALLCFGNSPKANTCNVKKIILAAQKANIGAIIAVGSGTINDLCKYAAHSLGLDYAVFATAPSMNGYVSANASITDDSGNKASLAAASPKAVFCDIEVLLSAPKRLIQSGLGDSLCRSTCQFDWLLSHLLFGTTYNSEPFEWLAKHEEPLFNSANKLVNGDNKSIELLMQTLLVSGEGMRHSGGSYPASQSEHMVAHTLDMMGISPQANYHGEEIAVTTLASLAIQEKLIETDIPPALTIKPFPTALMEKHFDKEKIIAFRGAYEDKCMLIEGGKKLTQKSWDDVRKQLHKVMLKKEYLQSILLEAGLRATPEELGWNNKDYQDATLLAPFTRNRFTVLDLI